MTHDADETARLILMDLPERSFGRFARELRAYYPQASLTDLQAVWDKYMGRDNRVRPTHHLETGNPL